MRCTAVTIRRIRRGSALKIESIGKTSWFFFVALLPATHQDSTTPREGQVYPEVFGFFNASVDPPEELSQIVTIRNDIDGAPCKFGSVELLFRGYHQRKEPILGETVLLINDCSPGIRIDAEW